MSGTTRRLHMPDANATTSLALLSALRKAVVKLPHTPAVDYPTIRPPLFGTPRLSNTLDAELAPLSK